MRPVPVPVADWDALINGPTHDVAVRARLMASDLSAVLVDNLPVVGGDVTVDARAAVRRTVTLALVDDDRSFTGPGRITPAAAGDPFAPYGAMVQVQYGVRVPGWADDAGQSWWWLDQGLFRISDTDVDGEGLVNLAGSDLARTVARSSLVGPYVIPAGTNYVDAIVALVATRLPEPVADAVTASLAQVVPTSESTPLIVVDDKADGWAKAREMARAIGYDVYFGGNGGLVLQPSKDPVDQPVQGALVEGQSALVSVGRAMSDDPGYNGVVVDAESTALTAPIRSVVWDANPNSPTYHQGPYGEVPYFMTSPYVASQAQADAAGRAELVRRLGATEQVRVAVVPDPARDPEDVLQIRRLRAGVDNLYVTDQLTLPFDVTAAMPLTCRLRTSIVDAA
jgi:hypothetical protein